MAEAALAEPGHNQPPTIAEQIRDALADDAAPILKRRDELLAAVDRAPAEVGDEEMAGKFADLVKLIMVCAKNAEAARVAGKEPHLEAGRAVDGFFRAITDPLAAAKKTIEQRLTLYQRRKADEERRRREEEERLRREEADRLAKEAAARAEAMKNDDDLARATRAEEEAKRAAADANRAMRDADAKAADLSRTRSQTGSVASLRTFWDFEGLERDALDLEALRHHLPLNALESAVRSFVKAGGRHLRGVRIFENHSTVVR